MKKTLSILFLSVCLATAMQAQVYNEIDASGNITQVDANGNRSGNFNPNNRDSTKTNKEVPKGVWAWTVDRNLGDIKPVPLDTMPHLFQNSIYATGRYGDYNTLGNNYTARQSRIFIDRTSPTEFIFTDAYSFVRVQPEDFHFINTLSPYTNITYDNCGNKQNGEDHIRGKFAVNANKRLGMGFDLDYHYGRGYYQNQNVSHFRSSIFASYRGDRYQMHALGQVYHHKTNENGGITNDNYVVHPELQTTQYSEDEIPTVLSSNWNRNNTQHLFLTQRYNVGFYRKVKMTEEEIQARRFAEASAREKAEKEKAKNGQDGKNGENAPKGRQNAPVVSTGPKGRPKDARIMGDEPTPKELKTTSIDTTRIVLNEALHDSLLAQKALQDSIDATMKKEYVPVTSFIHTLELSNYDHIYQSYNSPTNYYAIQYYDADYKGSFKGNSAYDKHTHTSVKNTVAIGLLEGFNKYMKAGVKLFASHEFRHYKMPFYNNGEDHYYLASISGHTTHIGGQLSKRQGNTFHFDLNADIGLTGMDHGWLNLDFKTDLNFPLFGDTVRLAANAAFKHALHPTFLENFHSKYLWWDKGLDPETRLHLEGNFAYDKTNTRLRVAIDEIDNYTYFGMSYTTTSEGRTGLTAGVYQESTHINVLTLQLLQNLRWGIFNWENVLTYQNSSMPSALPLPALNLFSNLYLKFKLARVLNIELGGSLTWFTKYEAPDYLPQLSVFAIQKNADSRVTLGNYPFIDVYANMHLKRARFFVSMTHVNAGSGSKMYFLTPHYPTNTRVFHMGISWNFYN